MIVIRYLAERAIPYSMPFLSKKPQMTLAEYEDHSYVLLTLKSDLAGMRRSILFLLAMSDHSGNIKVRFDECNEMPRAARRTLCRAPMIQAPFNALEARYSA